MATTIAQDTVDLVAVEGQNLDTTAYRGTAPLSVLAALSQADVFDQVTNPNGLQRGLSPKHASEAYQYATREEDEEFPRAFPEVFINVRDPEVVEMEEMNTGRQRSVRAFRFKFDPEAIADAVRDGKIALSRVDGNHRLWFAAGDDKRPPADVPVPFQITVGLTPEQEANLFVDVNANQKGLNSSHLHFLRSRLTPEEEEMASHPERVFARRLDDDPESPWHDLIYLGGSRTGSRAEGKEQPISFVTLESGVRRTLNKSQYIHDLTLPDAQYILLRNFWQAVKNVYEDEWENHKEYLLLKNVGVLAFSVLGGTVIDRCMARGAVSVEDMEAYVKQTYDVFDWSRHATGERSVSGMSGNRAILIIAGELASDLVDPGESKAIASIQSTLLGAEEVEPEEQEAETPEAVPA